MDTAPSPFPEIPPNQPSPSSRPPLIQQEAKPSARPKAPTTQPPVEQQSETLLPEFLELPPPRWRGKGVGAEWNIKK